MRPRLAIVTTVSVLLAGCTSGHTHATRSGDTTWRPPSLLSSSSAPVAAESVLKCSNSIDSHAATAPFQVVLGVVALPTSPQVPALGTSLTGDGSGPTRLFAKTGLVIKPGTKFELIVPPQFAGRLGVGWGGTPSTPSHRVDVAECPNEGGSGWLAYPGGYWIDHPACVPIIVKAGDKQQQVHIGVGAPCPGQQPPQGPSDS